MFGSIAPYLFMAAVLVSGVGGFFLGEDHIKAKQATEQELIDKVQKAATDASAAQIAKLRPIYTTIQNEVQREIRTNTVYADCRHSPDGLRLANQALNGGTASSSELPKTNPAK